MRIEPKGEDFVPTPEELAAAEDDPYFSEKELDELRSVICSNCALAHMCLKNWGYVREEAKKAVGHNPNNIKAWYRLGKAHEMMQNWEEAGNAIDSGLGIDKDNKELLTLQKKLGEKVRKARLHRQQRERARAERTSRIKEVWRYCKDESIALGRVPLVATVKDDEEEEEGKSDAIESQWHHHYPHTGQLPKRRVQDGKWTWPVLFVYPSHHQSDFIEHFGEDEILALRMAQMFPEQENDNEETEMPWDYNNEFRCSNLAAYFEVHCSDADAKVIHPDSVERLKDQGSAMRFYESSRALKGDEGPEMSTVARCMERKHLHHQRKAWIKKHGSLWARPDPCPVVQVHPAAELSQVLRSKDMVVPNFLVTIMLFPLDHPAHKDFLRKHNCLGIVEPQQT